MSPTKFKQIRTKLGLTQEGLAEMFGVAKLSISQYETGFRSPSMLIMVILSLLNSVPDKKAKELLLLISEHTEIVKRNLKRMKND